MDYVTIFLVVGAALVGSILGGLMSMLGTLLSNWLQWRSEKRQEKRQRVISRVENMKKYLSQSVAIAAQAPILEELEEFTPQESKRIFMKSWFEEVYPLRTLFYENPQLRKNLDEFDKTFVDVIGKEKNITQLQEMAAMISGKLDSLFEEV